MKLSLLPVLTLSFALFACSSDPAPDGPAPPQAGAPSASTDPAPKAPPARTLVTKRLAPAPAENLLVDPEFQSLWSPIDETGFGIYESFVQDGDYAVRFEPRTPIGPGFAVLSVNPSGGDATLTMTVLGGKGPLSVRVWVAAPKNEMPTVELVSLYEDSSVTLAANESTRSKIGDIEWVEMTGTSAGDMPGLLYLVATVNKAARFLAPRVTSVALPPTSAMATRSIVDRPASMGVPSSRAVNAARALERMRARYVTMSDPRSQFNIEPLPGRARQPLPPP